MTNEEFSNEFDVLIDSYKRFKAYDNREVLDSLEFNEYEKSVFLTEAQEALVKELYSSATTGDSIESTERIRRSLHPLIKERDIPLSDYVEEHKQVYKYKYTTAVKIQDIIDVSTASISQPSLWYILQEFAILEDGSKCLDGKIVQIIPTTHDAMIRTLNNPFRGPNNRKILRVDAGEGYIELYSNYKLKSYHVIYLSKPTPIILINLPPNLSIEKLREPSSTILPSSMHRNILELAVRLAIQSRQGNLDNNTNQDSNSNNNKNAE